MDLDSQHQTAGPDGHGEHAAHGHAPARPYRRLWLLMRPESRDLFLMVLFASAVAILSLASPIAVESLVNTVAFGILFWPVIVIAGVLLACLGLAAAIQAMQVYVVECLQRRLFTRVAGDYATRFPQIQLESLDDHYGPELANRFFDVLNVQKTMAFMLLEGIAIVVTSFVGMIVLAFYHPFLLGFDIILVLLMIFLLFVLGWGGIRTSIRESHAKYDVAAWLEELLRCIRTFKFSQGKHLAILKTEALTSEYVAARKSHFAVIFRQTVFALTIQVLASTALLALGGWLVINRQLTLGQLVAAELIVAVVVASIAKLGKYAESFYDLMAGAEKLGILTDFPLERTDGESIPRTNLGMAILTEAIHGVPHRTIAEVPQLQIQPNERVAIICPPSAGKTTFFELLCGLREPSDGRIVLDGIEHHSLNLDHLREQIAFVSGLEIFQGTVLDNVRVGRMEVTPADVRTALHQVGLTGAIHMMPAGLNARLVPTGSPFSGGQAIRLMIARAIVGKPRLLILDGTLDALDLRDCPELLNVLNDRNAPWTLLIGTILPEIAQLCDRTIELRK